MCFFSCYFYQVEELQMCFEAVVTFQCKGSGKRLSMGGTVFPWGKKAFLWAFLRDFLPGFAQAMSVGLSIYFYFIFLLPLLLALEQQGGVSSPLMRVLGLRGDLHGHFGCSGQNHLWLF